MEKKEMHNGEIKTRSTSLIRIPTKGQKLINKQNVNI